MINYSLLETRVRNENGVRFITLDVFQQSLVVWCWEVTETSRQHRLFIFPSTRHAGFMMRYEYSRDIYHTHSAFVLLLALWTSGRRLDEHRETLKTPPTKGHDCFMEKYLS